MVAATLQRTQPTPVSTEPERLIGLGVLARMVFEGADFAPLREQLLQRLARDENDAHALMDLSTTMQIAGYRDCGLQLQALALELEQAYVTGTSGGGPGQIRLLSIVCAGDLAENNALEFLVEGSDVALTLLYAGPGIPLPSKLPEHDVAMVSICQSDRNEPLLDYVDSLLPTWPRPVLCAPRKIRAMARDAVSLLLHSAPGVAIPVTRRLGRQEFMTDPEFPIVARPVDAHKGKGLKRLDGPEDKTAYLNERSEPEFYVAPYIDSSSPDGQFRKYRIMFIEGVPYVCHAAISSHWIVHYLSSGMVESATKRAEESRFFAGFDDGFARRHAVAMREICRRMDLEYFGIDCAETKDGQLLIFEVDSGMTIHAMDSVELFPYKQPQMKKVFLAFRRMLERAITPQDSSSIGET
jgi:glutathione synthase/RimK-type ligase-like ATP-grasp enzyme